VFLDVVLCFSTLLIRSPTPTYFLTVRMLVERTKLEKSIEEVLRKLMADKPMSEGVQASLNKGLQASPLTRQHSGHTNLTTEQ
jgi:hypothetical protein